MSSNSTLIKIGLVDSNATYQNSTMNYTNTTTQSTLPASISPPKTIIIIQTTLLATLGLVIVIGNLVAIVTFLKTQSLRRRCHYMIIGLSLADLLVGVSDLMAAAHFFIPGTKSFAFNFTLDFMDVLAGLASILTLAVIALERFYAIYFPFRHRTLRLQTYLVGILVPWITALFVALLFLIAVFTVNRTVGRVHNYARSAVVLIALVFIIVPYFCICLKMKKNNVNVQHQDRMSREKKLAVTLLIITVASLLTWLPSQVFLFALFWVKVKVSPLRYRQVVFVVKFLQFCNSGINVFIYIVRMPEFRMAFLGLLCKKKGSSATGNIPFNTRPTTCPRTTTSFSIQSKNNLRINPNQLQQIEPYV